MTIQLRAVTSRDAKYIKMLHKHPKVRACLYAQPPLKFNAIPNSGVSLSREADTFAIVFKGKPVGWLQLVFETRRTAVAQLVLHPDYWRRGIGAFALRWAKSRYGPLTARVGAGTSAYYCFCKQGFQVVGECRIINAAGYSFAGFLMEDNG